MDPLPDQDGLLERARVGDSAAFTALVRRHQRSAYSLALGMLRHPDRAEDIAQDAFVRLHQCLATFSSSAHLGNWLRRVVINLAIDQMRHERGLPTVALDPEVYAVTTGVEDDPLLQRRLWQLVAELPADPRAVVLLRYQEDLDPTDIAQTLEMPLNTVKSHLKRSLAMIRVRLQAVESAATEVASHG